MLPEVKMAPPSTAIQEVKMESNTPKYPFLVEMAPPDWAEENEKEELTILSVFPSENMVPPEWREKEELITLVYPPEKKMGDDLREVLFLYVLLRIVVFTFFVYTRFWVTLFSEKEHSSNVSERVAFAKATAFMRFVALQFSKFIRLNCTFISLRVFEMEIALELERNDPQRMT